MVAISQHNYSRVLHKFSCNYITLVVHCKHGYTDTTEVMLKKSLHIYTDTDVAVNLKVKAASENLNVSKLVEGMITTFLSDPKMLKTLIKSIKGQTP